MPLTEKTVSLATDSNPSVCNEWRHTLANLSGPTRVTSSQRKIGPLRYETATVNEGACDVLVDGGDSGVIVQGALSPMFFPDANHRWCVRNFSFRTKYYNESDTAATRGANSGTVLYSGLETDSSCSQMIFNRCSFVGHADEGAGIGYASKVLFYRCLFALPPDWYDEVKDLVGPSQSEKLGQRGHGSRIGETPDDPEDPRAGTTTEIYFRSCAFVNCRIRQPRFVQRGGIADIRNCCIWMSRNGVEIQNAAAVVGQWPHCNVVGNVFVLTDEWRNAEFGNHANGNEKAYPISLMGQVGEDQVHAADNYTFDPSNGSWAVTHPYKLENSPDEWEPLFGTSTLRDDPFDMTWLAPVATKPRQVVLSEAMSMTGMYPRDPVEMFVKNEMRSNKGTMRTPPEIAALLGYPAPEFPY